MIKFFRKIRQNLLSEGKTGKYLKYAVGEIFLVVIGILIALSINTWNQERLVKQEMKTNLINLSTAIKQDLDLLKEIEAFNDFRANSILQILKWTEIPFQEIDTIPIKLKSTLIWQGEIPKTFNAEFFEKSFLRINSPRSMVVQTYALDELKNSGLYSKLDNQELKNILNLYYSQLKWFFGQDEFSPNRFVLELRNHIMINYNLIETDIPFIVNPLETIKKDLGLLVRLREVRYNAGWRLIGAQTSITRAELLLVEIQREIDEI
ncbi:DUF6090 family protein [Algoriphagus sp.]|uniref:DUF6090 family protein n=1 Tax=Algoriphagus sp. TaxID=1872435 RepID=UPI00391BF1F2